MIYGYCRVSTAKQNIERQIRNILRVYPDADIRQEVFTGTKFQGRKELDKLLKQIHTGDVIVFDSVSRMSRNADEGVDLYMKLYKDGVTLVFLKEPHINTETYRKALDNQVSMTGTDADLILEGVNRYLMRLADNQIRLAFGQAQKEVDDMRQRTKEGIETARRAGKAIGGATRIGRPMTTKKAAAAKEKIREHNKKFGGTLTDEETMNMVKVTHNTFYKYKREIQQELQQEL